MSGRERGQDMVRIRALTLVVGVGAALLVALCGPSRAARRRRYGVVGRIHHLQGRTHGVWYRLCRGHPDEQVDDLVLADRIRSSLGPVEHALDQPRIHLSVHQHVATLHGNVATEYAGERLESEVRSVAGVVGVQSHLHVGLLPGDGCPSDALGRSSGPSRNGRQC